MKKVDLRRFFGETHLPIQSEGFVLLVGHVVEDEVARAHFLLVVGDLASISAGMRYRAPVAHLLVRQIVAEYPGEAHGTMDTGRYIRIPVVYQKWPVYGTLSIQDTVSKVSSILYTRNG